MADAKLTGPLQRIQANIAKLHPSVTAALQAQVKIEADDMVTAVKGAMDSAYRDGGSHDHQKVRDSVHAYPNPHRVISYFVLADAKDASGKFIGSNIEAGHLAADGTHVAPRPAFWPIYRALKKGMRRRMSAAGRKAVRALFPEV